MRAALTPGPRGLLAAQLLAGTVGARVGASSAKSLGRDPAAGEVGAGASSPMRPGGVRVPGGGTLCRSGWLRPGGPTSSPMSEYACF